MITSALWNSKNIFVFLDQSDIYFQFYKGGVMQTQYHTPAMFDADTTIQGLLAAHSSDPMHIFLHTDRHQFSHAQIAHFSPWEYIKLRCQLWWQQKIRPIDQSTHQVQGQYINRKNMATLTMTLSTFQNRWLKDMSRIPNPIAMNRYWIGDLAAQTFLGTNASISPSQTVNLWHIICAQLPHSSPIFIVCQGQNILFTRPYQSADFDQEQKATTLYLRRFGYKTTDILTVHHKAAPVTLNNLPELPRSFTLHISMIIKHSNYFLGQKLSLTLGPIVMLFFLAFSSIIWIRGYHIQNEIAALQQKINLFSQPLEIEIDTLGALMSYQNDGLPIMSIIHFLQKIFPPQVVVTNIKWSSTQIHFKLVIDPTFFDSQKLWPEVLEQLQKQFPDFHPEINEDHKDNRLLTLSKKNARTFLKADPKNQPKDKTKIKTS